MRPWHPIRHSPTPLRRRSQTIDLTTTAGKLADLKRRVAEVANAGSERAVEKQHARGKKTARERIEMLLDEGTFIEMDKYARHRSNQFGQEANRPYGDGVVTGYGMVDGRQVAIFAQDFTVFGGSLGEVFGEKIVKVMDFAMKIGCPVIGLNDSGGARIQEGVVSLGLYGEIFCRNVHASGVIPQISLIMGPCAGGAVYSPAITDFTVMVDQTSHMFITGPDVIKTVTGEDVGFEELGGAQTHNTKSGVAHYMGTDEQDAIDYVKALLSYLPSNNLETPPSYGEGEADLSVTDDDRWLDTCIPDSPNVPYDMHQIIEHVVDDGEFLEVQPLFAPNIITGFARDRRHVGRRRRQPADAVRRQPRHRRVREGGPVRPHLRLLQRAGADLRRRARLPARHLAGVGRHHPPRRQADLRLRRGHRPQDHRHHPQGLRRRLRRHGLQAPRCRHQPGLADGADRRDGRPGRGQHPLPQGAGRDGRARAATSTRSAASSSTHYEETLANPYIAAERGYIDTVISPSNTRMNVTRALRALRNKRETLPPKKHGNIPL